MLLMKKWLDNSQGLSSYGGFSFEKRPFSEANISRSKADFDARPLPMEYMDLLLAVYTHFRGGDGLTHGPQIAPEVKQLCSFQKT